MSKSKIIDSDGKLHEQKNVYVKALGKTVSVNSYGEPIFELSEEDEQIRKKYTAFHRLVDTMHGFATRDIAYLPITREVGQTLTNLIEESKKYAYDVASMRRTNPVMFSKERYRTNDFTNEKLLERFKYIDMNKADRLFAEVCKFTRNNIPLIFKFSGSPCVPVHMNIWCSPPDPEFDLELGKKPDAAWIESESQEDFKQRIDFKGSLDIHTDKLVEGHFKMMIYPKGLNQDVGMFLLGRNKVLRSEDFFEGDESHPFALVFLNSVVEHAAIPAKKEERFAIEVTFMRTAQTVPKMRFFSLLRPHGVHDLYLKDPLLFHKSSTLKYVSLTTRSEGYQTGDAWLNFDAFTNSTEEDKKNGIIVKKILFTQDTKIPIGSNSLSLVYSPFLFQYLGEKTVEKVLEESFRVLEPGGLFLLKIYDFGALLRLYKESARQDFITFAVEHGALIVEKDEMVDLGEKENRLRTWENKNITIFPENILANAFSCYWNEEYGDYYNKINHTQNAYCGPPLMSKEQYTKIFMSSEDCMVVGKRLRELAEKEDDFKSLLVKFTPSVGYLQTLFRKKGFSLIEDDKSKLIRKFMTILDIRSPVRRNFSAYQLYQKK